MPQVHVGRQENLEKALRGLKRKLELEGTLRTVIERKYYEKPSEKKRRRLKFSCKNTRKG